MGRRLVISDIHGCSKTLKSLIEKIALVKTDTLYFLGDYIDRGPDSSGVLDLILDLKQQEYSVIPLRGNHEENLLKAYQEYDADTFKFFVGRNKSSDIINNSGSIKEQYLRFFKDLPFFVELNDFILVHAGINFEFSEPFNDKVSLLELRRTIYNSLKAKNRKIIFGHQPYYFEDIIEAIHNKNNLIPLDNGCCYNKPHKYYDYTKLGNLLCLDIDSFKLTVQKNID